MSLCRYMAERCNFVMSEKSKKLSKKLDRPFEKKTWARAEKIAAQYQVIIGHEDGRWYGHGLEMPLAFGGGSTAQKCVQDTRLALVESVATMLERNEVPPLPASEGKRTEQVNIRLTAEEKALLSASAKSKGYRGIGDYIRASALAFRL